MAKAKAGTEPRAKDQGPPVDGDAQQIREYWMQKAIELGMRDSTALKMENAELIEYCQQILAMLDKGEPELAEVKARADEDAKKLDIEDQRKEFKSTRNELYAEGTRKVIIAASQDPSDDKTVYVGINGYPFWIIRGKEVEVPVAVLRVLNDAVIRDGRMQIGSSHEKPEMRFEDRPRFAWQRVDDDLSPRRAI